LTTKKEFNKKKRKNVVNKFPITNTSQILRQRLQIFLLAKELNTSNKKVKKHIADNRLDIKSFLFITFEIF